MGGEGEAALRGHSLAFGEDGNRVDPDSHVGIVGTHRPCLEPQIVEIGCGEQLDIVAGGEADSPTEAPVGMHGCSARHFGKQAKATGLRSREHGAIKPDQAEDRIP